MQGSDCTFRKLCGVRANASQKSKHYCLSKKRYIGLTSFPLTSFNLHKLYHPLLIYYYLFGFLYFIVSPGGYKITWIILLKLFKIQSQCCVFPFTLYFLIVLRLIKNLSEVSQELLWLSIPEVFESNLPKFADLNSCNFGSFCLDT